MERPSLRRQLVMIFLGIAIPIGILLGLLLYFSGLYNRNRLAAAASGGLDMFTTNFENQLDSVENYLLNLSLNDATFRSLSEQTDRTRAYLDAYEIAQGFPAVLAANDALMGVVLRSGSGNLYVGRYGATAQQLKQKLNLEAYLGQPGQTNKMMTKGWYLRTIGQRLYLLRSVFYQKASLTAAVDLRLVFEELVKDYGLDGRVIVMNDSGNVLVGDANLLPTKMEWNSAGYCLTKVGRDSRLVVRKQVKALTVLYLVPYQHFGVDFAPYQILLVMGAVFVLLAIPFILFYMKQEIFAPMTALVSTMDRIGRGELSVRSSVDYRNAEFTQVNETFNRMIDQITQLKIDGYEKELEARRNEMTALKLQIRPHFVLNCLKSVYAMVQTGSREDAQQLILLLSRYLRYILSFTATTTPLHTEIEQCCNYAELSSVGQNDPVEVVCEIDPELSELPLPPVSLLTLVDVPAFLPGKDQEQKGIIRHGAKILYAYSEATVPKVTLIMRKAYGGAYIAMNSKTMGADLVYAWPIAEIAVMGSEGAVEILYKKRLAASPDPETEFQQLKQEYEESFLNPDIAERRGFVDEVILPEETRDKLVAAFRFLDIKKDSALKLQSGKKHGNIPL